MYTGHTPAGEIIRSKGLSRFPGLVHGFGVRGVEVHEYLNAMGHASARHFATNQLHGSRVVRLEREDGGSRIEADAFITGKPGIVCHVRTADCVPILIADTKRRAIAAVHAGWRGTGLDIAAATLAEMNRAYGTEPADCCAAIGPCICGGCYEVGEDVETAMAALGLGDAWRTGPGRADLRAANAMLLERAGVPVSAIEIFPQCTRCDERFASFRRDKGRQRQVNFVAMT